MFDVLFRLILEQVERNPKAVFSESLLKKISEASFESLKDISFLRFVRKSSEHDTYYSSVLGDEDQERIIQKVKDNYYATAPGVDRIAILEEDITHWSFDATVFARVIKVKNRLSGTIFEVSRRVHFVGDAVYGNAHVFLGLFSNDTQAEAELLGLRSKTGKEGKILVLCPTYEVESLELSVLLKTQSIHVVTFKEGFCSIDLSMNPELFGNVPKDQKQQRTTTPAQAAGYDKFEYKCHDRVHIPGFLPKNRANEIKINGAKIKIGDSLFALFLSLSVASKKNKGGWMTTKVEMGKYQPFSNLRAAIQGYLIDKDGKKFIEADGSKRYRISTHPDFITFDQKKLRLHSSSAVKKLARQLPVC